MGVDEEIDPELVKLLEQRIEESGLSLRAFAEGVMRREYRTVKRWTDAEAPIPSLVVDFLRHPTPAPWPRALEQPVEPPDATTVMMDFCRNALVMLNAMNLGPLSQWLAPGLIRKELQGCNVPEDLMSRTEDLAERARVSLLRRPIDAAAALTELQQLWEQYER